MKVHVASIKKTGILCTNCEHNTTGVVAKFRQDLWSVQQKCQKVDAGYADTRFDVNTSVM